MSTHCILRGDKYRVVETDGSIVKNAQGNAVDGGGHDTAAACEAQSRAIKARENSAPDDGESWRPGDHKKLTRYRAHSQVNIDRDAGVIFGVSILTIGEAKGHEEFIDETMLEQCVEHGRAKEPIGLKSRFDHPQACSRSMGTFTGRFHNFRRDEDKVRADLHLSDASAKSPEGNLRDYILDLAAEDPAAFATSIVFRKGEPFIPHVDSTALHDAPDDKDPFWLEHARIDALHHCDVVDEGAASNGFFGRPDYMAEQAERWAEENDGIIAGILNRYFDNKNKKEGLKMADRTAQEYKAELCSVIKRAELAEAKTDELDEKLTVALAELAEAKTASYDDGVKAGIDRLKERLKTYGDNGVMVLESALDDDATFKDKILDALKTALSAKNKAGDADDGADATAFSESDDTGNSTFEAEVAKKVEAGKTKSKALSECSAEFPALHRQYIARTTKERKG